jgi:hypothetical protein
MARHVIFARREDGPDIIKLFVVVEGQRQNTRRDPQLGLLQQNQVHQRRPVAVRARRGASGRPDRRPRDQQAAALAA